MALHSRAVWRWFWNQENENRAYIAQHFDDLPEIRDWAWTR